MFKNLVNSPKSTGKTLLFLVLSLGVVFVTMSVTAQTAAPAAAAPAAGAPAAGAASPAAAETAPLGAEGNKEAAAFAEAGELNIFHSKDPALWILMALFLVALAIGADRLWVILNSKSANAELVRLVTEKLSQNPATGEELAKEVSDPKYGVEGRIVAVTLKGWQHDEDTIQSYANAATVAERRYLSSRLPILSTLGNNAPFIGLLGTVLGIMKAFRDLAGAADAGPQVVMKGISEALVATAMGLGVAIPCVMLFNYFSSVIKRKMSNSEEVTNIIVALRRATRSGK
ncbi:MotA/TolQ/ExbB proton channel family protein [Turneriella parva]|uniref:Outer membrane transport energization protein ExbB n=1 Tax=Turneriella parva (strain ATCC BAA-1111 / DSM 21527 / NCTC 11395 / H) TaxID=869212 RepID=I4B0S1_TURPD|nr:MotA/TolQ/ExbB proton channel family protein [Turneriella parva]AFM10878.1 outer membrane transport energization protein ExbB [Turneriella parva DSM 21527]